MSQIVKPLPLEEKVLPTNMVLRFGVWREQKLPRIPTPSLAKISMPSFHISPGMRLLARLVPPVATFLGGVIGMHVAGNILHQIGFPTPVRVVGELYGDTKIFSLSAKLIKKMHISKSLEAFLITRAQHRHHMHQFVRD